MHLLHNLLDFEKVNLSTLGHYIGLSRKKNNNKHSSISMGVHVCICFLFICLCFKENILCVSVDQKNRPQFDPVFPLQLGRIWKLLLFYFTAGVKVIASDPFSELGRSQFRLVFSLR